MREIASPAAPGSGEPNLAVTANGTVLSSWIEGTGEPHSLRFSILDGAAWSPPRTIAAGRGWFVNWADFPTLAALPDGTLFAHWLAKTAASPYAYGVHVTSSADRGTTWSPAVVPHRDGTRTEHGFVSMTPATDGAMGLVWLDGRKTASTPASDGHDSGEMALYYTTVARDGALGPETALDDRVCDCCQTDAVRADGATIVVYRDRSPEEVRDIGVVRLVDGRWSAPRLVAADGWQIHGCPVNGPAVAAAGRDAVVAWFTSAAETPRVKVAFSGDSGATFGSPIVVDDGRPLGRVDVAMLESGEALVAWLEQGDKGAASLRLRRVARDGSGGAAMRVAESTGARSSGFPRMVRAGARVVLAWRDASDPPRVRTAIVDAPAGSQRP